MVVGGGARRRHDRHRLDIRAARLRRRHPRSPRGRRAWAASPATSGPRSPPWCARCATRAARRRRVCAVRGRRGAVGPQGPAARAAVAPAARRCPRRGARVRQRRVHHLRRRAAAAQLDGWLGSSRSRASRSRLASRGVPRCRATWRRMAQARDLIGPDVELYVDANGGYGRKQAVRVMEAAAECDVRWFEEPVSSDDLIGLRMVARRGARRRRGGGVRRRPHLLPSGCARRARSIACRPTRRGAAGSPSGCGSRRSRRRTTWKSPGTARRTCTPMSRRRRPTCAIWSGSTTTSASRRLLFDGTLDPAAAGAGSGTVGPDPRAGVGGTLAPTCRARSRRPERYCGSSRRWRRPGDAGRVVRPAGGWRCWSPSGRALRAVGRGRAARAARSSSRCGCWASGTSPRPWPTWSARGRRRLPGRGDRRPARAHRRRPGRAGAAVARAALVDTPSRRRSRHRRSDDPVPRGDAHVAT